MRAVPKRHRVGIIDAIRREKDYHLHTQPVKLLTTGIPSSNSDGDDE